MEINLETLLGVLAAYFAIMAVLAVGTEVVLDILKIKALKKTTSPSQALADLKQWVPPEKWDDLDKRVEHMNEVIKELDETLAKTRAGVRELRQQAQPILKAGEALTSVNLASVMRKLEARYEAVSANRIAWIRFWSLVIGMAWAVILQINTLDLLAPVIPNTINNMLGGSESLWYRIAGLGLSGLGASAGSSFWYEQMARLRQTRQMVTTAEELKAQVDAIAASQFKSEA
jgi:hypothetical protein